MSEKRIVDTEALNWEAIAGRVMKTIIRQLRKYGMPVDGVEEDLAQQVITAALASPNNLGFDPKKVPPNVSLEDGLAYFLTRVATYRVADYARASARYSSLESLDSAVGGFAGEPESGLLAEELRRELIGLVPGDMVAIGVINASLNITGGGNVHQELAELVFGDPRDTKKIINATKRIRRALEREQNKRATAARIAGLAGPTKASKG